jgi:hypothetical protein
MSLGGAWLLWRQISPAINRNGERERLQSLLPGEKSWLFANDEPSPPSSSREFVQWMLLDSSLALGIGLLGVNELLFGSGLRNDTLKNLVAGVLTLGSALLLVLVGRAIVKRAMSRPRTGAPASEVEQT